jgi:hypothetical protein
MDFIIYLIIHGTVTLGAVVGFLLRTERRLTRIETIVELCFKNPGVLKKPE